MLKISNNNANVFMLNITSNEKSRLTNVGKYLVISPEHQRTYFDIKPPFNPVNLLKSPMGIMIGMTVLMMVCMNNMPDPGKVD